VESLVTISSSWNGGHRRSDPYQPYPVLLELSCLCCHGFSHLQDITEKKIFLQYLRNRSHFLLGLSCIWACPMAYHLRLNFFYFWYMVKILEA